MTRLCNLLGYRLTREDAQLVRDAYKSAPDGRDPLLHAANAGGVSVWVARAILSGQPVGEP
jgi:hypothetical protein